MSHLLITTLLLQYAFAQPVGQHLAMAGGSISKILPPAAKDMFLPQLVKHDKRDAKWIVQAGDTGNGIALRLGIDFVQLASINPTVQWTNLQIGQILTIPCDDSDMPPATGGSQYTVVAGDTGNAIAAAAGISFAQLDSANPGVNWYNLQIGQVLTIPGSATSITTTTPIFSTTTPEDSSTTTLMFSTTTSAEKSTFTPILSTTMSEESTTITPISPPTEPTSSPTESIPPAESSDPETPPETTIPTDSSTSTTPAEDSDANSTTPDDENVTDENPTQPYPTDGPGSNPFLTPGSKRDLPIVKIRLVRNEQVQTKYKVKAGDTGYAIASVYGISFQSLSDANPGVIWTNLQIGQNLNLPQNGKTYSSVQTSSSVQSQPRKAGQDVYVTYSGPAAIPPYPAMSNWLDFETLWNSNLANIGTNCEFPSGKVVANTKAETAVLKKAIQAVSAETSVSASFILATILQESAGCVRAPTTKSWEGFSNPGLMQSFRGRASCNTGSRVMQPCSDSMIKSMIIDGVKGNVNVGIIPALETAAAKFGVSWPMTKVASQAQAQQGKSGPLLGGGVSMKVDEALLYYQAARIYNSGSIPADGNLSGETGSTKCYVSDVVNRLMGWVNSKRQCS